jgi:hypothetical protein
MKKIVVGIVMLGLVFQTSAQEAADKKVQAGLVFGYGMAFQKMETKYLKTNGIGSDLTIGANMNYGFNENIGLNIGLEFDFETLKYKAGDKSLFYAYNDSEIIPFDSNDGADNLFQLLERKQKPIYLTIPTMVLFRTKFIGYFRYFGKFGLKTSFLLGNKINDEGLIHFSPTPFDVVENKNMTAKNEMFFMKSSVGLAGGAEWNFIGSTCLAAEIGYYYGFVPLYYNKKSEDRYLVTPSDGNINNNAKQSQLMFKLSILF